MKICFFGADDSWSNLKKTGFTRRNTNILNALNNSDKVECLFVFNQTTRLNLFLRSKEIWNNRHSKTKDIYLATFFPRNRLFNYLNKLLSELIIKIQMHDTNDLILWSYLPKGYNDMVVSGLNGFKVFDADHNIIQDPNLNKSEREVLIIQLKEIIKNTDIGISSTRSMNNWMNENNLKNIYRLRNGVDPTRFEKKREAKSSSIPKIGYCGTLSNWMDFDLLFKLVRRNPNWQFEIIGSSYLNEEGSQLDSFSNVKLLGKLNSKNVTLRMKGFDIALNVYKKHPALDVDSMKLYEYIAAGIPVVSTNFHDFLEVDFHNIIEIAKDCDEFQKKIEKILSIGKQIDTTEFLVVSSWQRRIEEFLNEIKSLN